MEYVYGCKRKIKLIKENNTFLDKLLRHDDPSFKIKSNLNEMKLIKHATS